MRALALAFVVLSAPLALAKNAGIAASSCGGCHGATTAAVSLSASPATVAPGATTTLTVSITSANNGGFFLSSSAGTFSLVTGQLTRLSGSGVVHSSPAKAVSGKVTFLVKWTAPSSPGGADFDVQAVAGNGSGTNAGDGIASARFNLVYGCAGITLWADNDGDGHGAAANVTTKRCAAETGWSTSSGDCNDNDERVFPGKVEACNGADDNCNGTIDEGLSATTTWPDVDGDGYGDVFGTPSTGCTASGRAANQSDCNDKDSAIRPGVKEVCNLKDDNCNSTVDEGVRVRCGVGWCARYGPNCDPLLCTPGKPVVEICNYLDDDCDGQTDEGVTCPSGQACYEGECILEPNVPPPDTTDAGAGTGGSGGAGGGGGVGSGGAGGVGGSGGGGGGMRGPSGDGAACSSVNPSSALPLAVLLWAVRRKRRPVP